MSISKACDIPQKHDLIPKKQSPHTKNVTILALYFLSAALKVDEKKQVSQWYIRIGDGSIPQDGYIFVRVGEGFQFIQMSQFSLRAHWYRPCRYWASWNQRAAGGRVECVEKSLVAWCGENLPATRGCELCTRWVEVHPQGIVGCTPGPTYPYGKSLFFGL